MIEFFGWELPVYYSSIKEEAMAIRQKVGLFDVSHMGEIFVTGEDAEEFINYIITNSTFQKEDHSIVYSLMCDKKGFAVDDLLVYKFNKKHFLLVVNASNADKDHKWLLENRKDFNIDIQNRSKEYALIAVQGPRSIELINGFFPIDVAALKYYWFAESTFNDNDCLISRTGYTGEQGFELLIHRDHAVRAWNALLDKGKNHGILPCGLGARDLLRIEVGFPLYGHELNEKINPIEANLGWVIKLDKECDFIGKENLKEFKEKLSRKRIGFIMDRSKIAREDSVIMDQEEHRIGSVTSGTFSFCLKRSIGMGIIEKKYIDIGKLKINIGEKIFTAEITHLPFVKIKN